MPGLEVDRSEELRTGVDEVIASQTKDLLAPAYADEATEVVENLFVSPGMTNAYLLCTPAGRVIVNTGLWFEAPHHRKLFDAVCAGPTPFIITTQAHTDHVGGVALFRDETTTYVAHELNPEEQHHDHLVQQRGREWALPWFDVHLTAVTIRRFADERPDLRAAPNKPTPDRTFSDRLQLDVGSVSIELHHGVGETRDGAMVWLPHQRTAIISNLLGPLIGHFPNLCTLRGQKYRFVEPYLATIRRLRDLQPEVLVTGRGVPLRGAELIAGVLTRVHDAVDYVHTETLNGINAGTPLPELIRTVQLPPHLHVGEGYGRVDWGVRTIWETYLGWFRHEGTTPLLGVDPSTTQAQLVELAGVDQVLALAGNHAAMGELRQAIALTESARACTSLTAPESAKVSAALNAYLNELAADESVAANFWLSGWIAAQLKTLEGED